MLASAIECARSLGTTQQSCWCLTPGGCLTPVEVRRRAEPPPRRRGYPGSVTTPPPPTIQPATGRLGVLTVGLGAVASTLIAGVELAKRGMSAPDRLAHPDGHDPARQAHREPHAAASRTSCRSPPRRHRVRRMGSVPRRRLRRRPREPACSRRGKHIEAVSDALREVRPMPAAFDREYVKRHRRRQHDAARSTSDRCSNAIREDINRFRDEKQVDRVVMIWCASHRDLHRAGPGAHEPRGLRGGDRRQRPDDRAVDALRVRGDPRGRAVRQRRAEPDGRHPGAARARHRAQASRSAARTSRPARR